MAITDLLIMTYGGNTVQQYLTALGVFIASVIVLWIIKVVVIKKLKKFSKQTKNDIDDLIIAIASNFGWPIYLMLAIYLGLLFVAIPMTVNSAILIILLIIIIYYAAKAAQDVITYGTNKVVKYKRKEDKDTDPSIIILLSKLLKITVWMLAILLVISNLGYDISTLLAGLGIGGLAIAFALQSIFADLFASLSIYFDKPFKKGDYIVIGADSGVVKQIGIKTTRLQTLQGEELVVSNTELTSARVHNYKKMDERRVVFALGLTYDTNNAKMKKVPSLIKKVIDKAKLAEFGRAHFKSFGDFSLNYEVVYFMKSSAYDDYMDTQQEINLEIKKIFEKEKIDMAFPTQTVFVSK